jgi:hypothetical protein
MSLPFLAGRARRRIVKNSLPETLKPALPINRVFKAR